MNALILDTNILLDIFVFNDERAKGLKAALIEKSIQAFASQKTVEEFAEVISRPLFSLKTDAQEQILGEWKALATQIDDSTLSTAPWLCRDPDDQIFLDLAYALKPCTLISKDREILKIASRAHKEEVTITQDYNAFR